MKRKVRSDAVLLNLPEERQEQIIEWCDTPKSESCAGGYEFAREQLAADGLKVSVRALSDFYSDWHLRRDLQTASNVEAAVRSANPGEAKLAREAGEAMLLKLSLARQDAKLFTAAACSIDSRERLDLDERSAKTKAEIAKAKIRQKDHDLRLAERRVAVLEKKFADAKKTLSDPSLSISEREARMKEMFGLG